VGVGDGHKISYPRHHVQVTTSDQTIEDYVSNVQLHKNAPLHEPDTSTTLSSALPSRDVHPIIK
jgi:hypothetical protein